MHNKSGIILLSAGRPKDEEPHIKQYTKNKKEIIEYIVSVNLEELGIDSNMFDELKALFELFDLDRDGVLILAEFEKVLRALGRSCKNTWEVTATLCSSYAVQLCVVYMTYIVMRLHSVCPSVHLMPLPPPV